MNKDDNKATEGAAQTGAISKTPQDRDALYIYQAESEAGVQRTLTGTQRPLPSLPSAPPALSGQSRTPADSGHANEATHAMRGLHIGGLSRDKGIESFVLRQLPMFAGTYNGDLVREWIGKIEILKKIIGIPDEDLIRLLPLRMSTRAADYLQGYVATLPREQITWDVIKNALLTQYGGKPDPTKLVNQLHSTRMGRDTPVREYAHEVERLARLAYPELTSDVEGSTPVQRSLLNRISLEQFVSGLPPLLSRAIVEKKIDDFQEAVQMAAHLEEVNARFMKRTTINALHNAEVRTEDPSSSPNRPSGNQQMTAKSASHNIQGAFPEDYYPLEEGDPQIPQVQRYPETYPRGYYFDDHNGSPSGYRRGYPSGYRGRRGVYPSGYYSGGSSGDRPGPQRHRIFPGHHQQPIQYHGNGPSRYRGGFPRGNRSDPRMSRSSFPRYFQQAGEYNQEFIRQDSRQNLQNRPFQFPRTPEDPYNCCYRCGDMGHFAKNCPHPQCPICRGSGHTPNNCPSFANPGGQNPGPAAARSFPKNFFGRPRGRPTN